MISAFLILSRHSVASIDIRLAARCKSRHGLPGHCGIGLFLQTGRCMTNRIVGKRRMTAYKDQPLAAIHFGKDEAVDPVLRAAVQKLKAEGLRVGGFVQHDTPDPVACCSITHVEDVMTGVRHRITQALGAGSKGCRLDPQALADVAGRLLATLEEGVDLIVLNRFGKGESDGQGLRAVIETAIDRGVPVLIAVRDTYRADWEAFSGDLAAALPMDPDRVADWGRAAMASARASSDAA
jgi:nucleoside-triphosphatase THEP1